MDKRIKTLCLILALLAGSLHSTSSWISSQDDAKCLKQAWDILNKPYVVYDCISLEIIGKCDNWRAIDVAVGNKECEKMSYGSIDFFHFNGKSWERGAYWEYGSKDYVESSANDALKQLLEYKDSECIITLMRLRDLVKK